MEAFLISTGVVALAEIGDKTQLLAIVLAARFRRPVPIVLGILVATLLNHALAGAVGVWLASLLGERGLRWALGASFIAMAIWMLVPDKYEEQRERVSHGGVFVATLVAFFLLEIGDIAAFVTAGRLAAYAGLAPVTRRSGSSIKGEHSPRAATRPSNARCS